ncbi:MAG: N-glycosylase/DNA lyase [Candidatus Aenigmarchaeota archaeon]|nr:N-glycosylase/DNA lyase [Candidatus Aenigmarchaeota archaeon]
MDKNQLIEKIIKAKESQIAQKVEERTKSFNQLNKEPDEKWFSELCFCILTANYNAEGAIKIQENLGCSFAKLPKNELSKKLKVLKHRFPNKRAEFIFEAQKHSASVKKTILSLNEQEARKWLVKNIKGIGMKEASHFLRNVGYTNSAIIDFHIIDILVKYSVIERPKNLNEKTYLTIEEKLKSIADECDLNLAELDLYLWYFETGMILK